MATGLKRPIKPRQVVLAQRPITRGLVFDTPFTERGGTTPSDLLGKIKSTFAGAPTWVTDLYGSGLSFSGSTDGVSFATPTGSPTQGMASFSYECMFNMTGLGGGSTGYIVCKSNAGPPYFLLSAKTSTTLQILSGFATAQGSWTVPIAQNAIHHLVLNYTMNTSSIPVVWIDGIQQTVTTSVSPSGTAPTDNANIYIGNNSGGTRNWAGQIFYVRMWNRYLSQSEVMSLNKNPWSVYRNYY